MLPDVQHVVEDRAAAQDLPSRPVTPLVSVTEAGSARLRFSLVLPVHPTQLEVGG